MPEKIKKPTKATINTANHKIGTVTNQVTTKKKNIRVSILIPAHNEERTIAECIDSCLDQTRRPNQILVIDDGSSDKTSKIVARYQRPVRLLKITKPTGNKSRAQEYGLPYITGSVFICVDADTKVDRNFVERVEKTFLDQNISAFCGYVRSSRFNWLTSFREYEYYTGQFFHKLAQSKLNTIIVIPGCASAFRTKIFKKYCTFDHDTITEDMDFTYKLHKNDQKIVYDPLAKVYTQDPHTLRLYIAQMKRWYAGAWQNLRKHKSILRKPNNSLEIVATYFESTLFGALLYLVPFYNLQLYITAIFFLMMYLVLTSLFIAISEKRADIFIYSPLFIIIVYLNSFLLISELVKEIILKNTSQTWSHIDRRSSI